jgi:excisionase family DNA binding protein
MPTGYDPRSNLFSAEEAAERLSISRITLRRWCKRGELPFVRIGSHLYIAESDIIEWIEVHKERGEPPS